MPNIFDNLTDDARLGPALRDSLTDFETVDCATGYLDLRGWSSFADIVETKLHGEASSLKLLAEVDR